MKIVSRIIGTLTLSLIILGTGCALFKGALRTANDLATVMCEIFAEEHEEELAGMSPKAWCGVHDHLAPFLDAVLSAEQVAGIEREGE